MTEIAHRKDMGLSRRSRIFGLAAIGSAAAGMLGGGYWSTRSRPPAMLIRPADPNTGCGSVSLKLVGHWLGKPMPLADLNRLTHSYDTGTSSILDMKQAARSMGLAAEAVRLDPARAIPWRLPMILHVGDFHFIAALPIDGDRIVLADPPKDPTVIDRRRLAVDWRGVALVVAGTQSVLDQALADAHISPEK